MYLYLYLNRYVEKMVTGTEAGNHRSYGSGAAGSLETWCRRTDYIICVTYTGAEDGRCTTRIFNDPLVKPFKLFLEF
jgi:hypothetical protein